MAHTVRDKEKLLNRVRRLRGQLNAVEKGLLEERDCSEILHSVSACRGAINALMNELVDGHIRFHVADPDHNPTSAKSKAVQEVLDIVKSYMK